MPNDVIAQDLPSFFATADFATEADHNGTLVRLILSERHFSLEEGDMTVETQPVEAMVEKSAGIEPEDILTVGTQQYRVKRRASELEVDRLTLHPL